MKTKIFLFVMLSMFALAITACSGGESNTTTGETKDVAEAAATAIDYEVDVAKTTVEWIGKKVTGQHNGTIDMKSGNLKAENGMLTAGNFTVDMTSIAVVDLTDEEMNGQLTGHLNSEDFFNTAEHPEATFEITEVKKNEGTESSRLYEVSGNLTIKGISNGITFPADITITEEAVDVKADFDVDRTAWDIKYGSGKFFDGLGDKMIDDNFTLAIKLHATPKAA